MPAYINELVLVVHLIGMAMLVGSFILFMRSKDDFPFATMVTGAWIQIISGSALLGFAEMNADKEPVDHIKFTVKIVLVVAALIAASIGKRRQEKGEKGLQPFFHTAGGFALINVLIAVLWNPAIWS